MLTVKNRLNSDASFVRLSSGGKSFILISYYRVYLVLHMHVQGSPSQVNGVGLRTLSRRRSWVQIPPPAPKST